MTAVNPRLEKSKIVVIEETSFRSRFHRAVFLGKKLCDGIYISRMEYGNNVDVFL